MLTQASTAFIATVGKKFCKRKVNNERKHEIIQKKKEKKKPMEFYFQTMRNAYLRHINSEKKKRMKKRNLKRLKYPIAGKITAAFIFPPSKTNVIKVVIETITGAALFVKKLTTLTSNCILILDISFSLIFVILFMYEFSQEKNLIILIPEKISFIAFEKIMFLMS